MSIDDVVSCPCMIPQLLSLFDILSARLVRIQAHVAQHGITTKPTTTSSPSIHDMTHDIQTLQTQIQDGDWNGFPS